MLAIVSSYYIGKRRQIYSHYTAWNRCQSGLIYFRSFLVSLLALRSLTNLTILSSLFHIPSNFVTVCLVSLQTFSWILHLIYIFLLKRGNSFNTRGPKLAMLAWFLTAILSLIKFRSAYIHFSFFSYTSQSSVSFLLASLDLLLHALYFLTLIPASTHLEQRHYRHRSQVNDIVYNAYESQENNSFVGFDEDDPDEGLPLGIAKENSSIFSRLLFLWVNPLIRKGACGYLTSTDSLFDLPHSISTQSVSASFSTNRHSLLRSLHIRFGLQFYSIGLLKLVSDCCGFAGPILLNLLVSFIEDESPEDNPYQGYAYVGAMFLTVFLGALANSHFNMSMAEVNLKIRAALITTIYRKTINLRKFSLEKFSTGEIINFMSTDTDRIVNFCPSFHAFWSLPVQVAVTLYLLYMQIGIAFLAGVVFAILLIPVNRWLANKIGELSTKMMSFKDQRVKLMSELLYGIKVLKFHAWEPFFAKKINGKPNEMVQRS